MRVQLLYGLLAFLATLGATRFYSGFARQHGWGQRIRDYGPEIHARKAGTPTMGGLVLLVLFPIFAALLWARHGPRPAELLLLGATLGYGGLGLLDDLLGVLNQRSLGLRIGEKLLLQTALGLLLLWGLRLADAPLGLKIPFVTLEITLPFWAYALLVLFVFLSMTNALNLTDGLDGLAVGTTLIMLLPYLFLIVRDNGPLWGIALIFAALLLGFLWHNCYPAGVFLGDTGSMALGGFLAMLSLLTGTALFLPLFALVPLLEALSVLIQVFSFRVFGTRVFKVSPLHHHFERAVGIDYKYLLPNRELPEVTITIRFWIVAAVGALLGLLAYF